MFKKKEIKITKKKKYIKKKKSLFKDYSQPFVFKKPVSSNPKILNRLREFYKPNTSKEEILENIQKINSLLWKDMRIGRITASIVYHVLHTNIDKRSASVIKNICTPAKKLNVPAKKVRQ